jgi:hypothetical protein
MKSFIYAAMFSLGVLLSGIFMVKGPFARAQTIQPQIYDGKIIIPSTYGDLICLGSWDAELSRCSGPQVSSGALTAITAVKSAEKLEQIRVLLTAINNQLAENPPAARGSVDRQTRPGSESPSQANVETSTDVSVKEEVESLREEILEAGPAPTGPEAPAAGAE